MNLIYSILDFFASEQFNRDLISAIPGLFLQLILLSIFLPVLLGIIKHYKNKNIRMVFYLYISVAFNEILRAILHFLFIERDKELEDRLYTIEKENNYSEKHKFAGIYSGDIERYCIGILSLYKDKFSSLDLENLKIDRIIECSKSINASLETIDKATFMAIPYSKLSSELFQIRSIVFTLDKEFSNIIDENTGNTGKKLFIPLGFHNTIKSIIMSIEYLFDKKIRPIERQFIRNEKKKVILWILRMYIYTFATMLLHPKRFIGRNKNLIRRRNLVRKFKKKYKPDPSLSNEMFFNFYILHSYRYIRQFEYVSNHDFDRSFKNHINNFKPESRKEFIGVLNQFGIIQEINGTYFISDDLWKTITDFMNFNEESDNKIRPPNTLLFKSCSTRSTL